MDGNSQAKKNINAFSFALSRDASSLIGLLQEMEYDQASELIFNIILQSQKDADFYQQPVVVTALIGQVVSVQKRLDTFFLMFRSALSEIQKGETIEAYELQCSIDANLKQVCQLAAQATNNTLDEVEFIHAFAEDFSAQANSLSEEWQRLSAGELSFDEYKAYYFKMDAFFQHVNRWSCELKDRVQRITVDQSYQDLTGQAVQRVTQLLGGLDEELAAILNINTQLCQSLQNLCRTSLQACDLEKRSAEKNGAEKSNATNKNPTVSQDYVSVVNKTCSQGDADDLLSKFGM